MPLKSFAHDHVIQAHIMSLMHTRLNTPSDFLHWCNLSFFTLPTTPLAFLLSILEARSLQNGQYESYLLSHYPQNSRKDAHFYLQWDRTITTSVQHEGPARRPFSPDSSTNSCGKQWAHRPFWACFIWKTGRSKWEREKKLIILSRWKKNHEQSHLWASIYQDFNKSAQNIVKRRGMYPCRRRP